MTELRARSGEASAELRLGHLPALLDGMRPPCSNVSRGEALDLLQSERG